jgi:metal-dependent HD superfamily phosphatase/phosphodiesterase
MTKSPKEEAVERAILGKLKNSSLRGFAKRVLQDEEVHAYQEYANSVSIMRLKYNDHGPVHMRTVVLNALTLADLLHEAGVLLSLEKEELGSYDDSLAGIFLSGMLHDIGMGVTRMNHENLAVPLALPIVERFLKIRYPDDIRKQVMLRTMIVECITGHMGIIKVNSLEAGIILIADGTDMEKGRARIPMMLSLSQDAKVGDIHQYSSAAIEDLEITKGAEKPIRISIKMKSDVGFFQVEEVLFPKMNMSPIKPYVELYASVIGGPVKKYL